MRAIIPVITNGMSPKTLLPNPPTFVGQNLGPSQFHIRQGFRKSLLDRAPAVRIIRIIFRQGLYTMLVIWQNDPGVDMKRGRQANRTNGGPERFDFPHQQVRPAVCQVDREEERSPWDAVAALVRHCRNVSTFSMWRNSLARVGCGARDGGWARWECSQRWRKALRFSALRLLRDEYPHRDFVVRVIGSEETGSVVGMGFEEVSKTSQGGAGL
jgi:hypothetical protein